VVFDIHAIGHHITRHVIHAGFAIYGGIAHGTRHAAQPKPADAFSMKEREAKIAKME